jgi:hypothetical protein
MTISDAESDHTALQANAHTDTASGEHAQPTRAGFADLRRGLFSALIGFAAYYGARYCGAPPLEALLVSTTASALRVAYSAWRTRRFDPIAGFLMAADGITLAVGLLSRSPVITMLGQHIPGIVFEIFVIIGLVRNRPITESLLAWLRPGWVEQHITQRDWGTAETHAYHRTHQRLTLAVAIAGLLHLVAAAIVIFTLPVDIAKGALGLLALATDAVIVAIVVGGIGKFVRRQ